MTTKARAEFDHIRFGVRIAVVRETGEYRQILSWAEPSVRETRVDAPVESTDDQWLRLPEGDARAIYEALAEHFGHAGHDTRALRKDYDAERARVDKFIAHLTNGGRP